MGHKNESHLHQSFLFIFLIKVLSLFFLIFIVYTSQQQTFHNFIWYCLILTLLFNFLTLFPIKTQLIGAKEATFFSVIYLFIFNYKPFDLCFGWPSGVLIKNGVLSTTAAHILPSIRPVQDITLNVFIDKSLFTAHFIYNVVKGCICSVIEQGADFSLSWKFQRPLVLRLSLLINVTHKATASVISPLKLNFCTS